MGYIPIRAQVRRPYPAVRGHPRFSLYYGAQKGPEGPFAR